MILVTGATGRVGGQVAAQLTAAGVPVRALIRAAAPPGVEAVHGDLTDPSTVEAAAKGVDAVFLVFPTLRADRAAPEVVAALTRDARHVVYLSAAGADPAAGGILGSHGRLERLLERSGVAWTFLRPSGFAANTLLWADQVRTGDVVRWFHGAATRSPIHERDIAAVGVRALTEDGHAGARYHITGPERLTQVQQVAAIGEAIGRPLRFEQLPPDVARDTLFPGTPPELADSIIAAHGAMVRHPEPVTDTVAALLGRPALTYRRWTLDHAVDFR
jgi:uncharacterized protein YbjT (DUF2867 family)